MAILTLGNAAIKYTDDCGFYAFVGGRCIQDEIDGTYDSAFNALAAHMDANRTPADNQPGWEFLPY